MQFYIQKYICGNHRGGLLKKKKNHQIKSNVSLESGIVYVLMCTRLLLSFFQMVTDLSYLFVFFWLSARWSKAIFYNF